MPRRTRSRQTTPAPPANTPGTLAETNHEHHHTNRHHRHDHTNATSSEASNVSTANIVTQNPAKNRWDAIAAATTAAGTAAVPATGLLLANAKLDQFQNGLVNVGRSLSEAGHNAASGLGSQLPNPAHLPDFLNNLTEIPHKIENAVTSQTGTTIVVILGVTVGLYVLYEISQ
jgi:hypothetical protein